MRVATVAFAFAFACCFGTAYSQERPSEKQASQTTEDRKGGGNQQGIPFASPSQINVTVSGKLDVSAPQQSSKDEGKKGNFWESFFLEVKLTDVLLVIFTALLWWVTGGLRSSTDKLWGEAKVASGIANSSAETARDSVELARDEFHASHRPRFIVRRVRELVEDKDVVGVEYSIYNIGDADGKMIAVSSRIWLIAEQNNLPPVPPYNPPEPLETIIEPGAHILIKARVPDADQERLGMQYGFYRDAEGPGGLLFLGYIDYSDMRGAKRETAFLRQFDFATKRFSPVPHQEYEYQD